MLLRSSRSFVTHRWLFAAAVAVALSLTAAGSAAALGKKETKCQKAVATAGRTLLVKSLLARAKCATMDLQEKTCSPDAKVTKAENKARAQIVKSCTGATLTDLSSGGCAADSSSPADMASCIVESHGAAVLDLITEQFGRSVSSSSVTISGNLVSSMKTLLVGPHLRVAGVTTQALALTDLKLYCVTFEEPPAAGSSDVSASGSFSVTLSALGIPFGCFVIDSTSGEQVATLVLRRATTSLSGNSNTDTTQITTDENDLNLGAVTLNLDMGIAIADAANVDGDIGATVDNPFDPSGTWNFNCVEPPADSGYSSCYGGGPGGPGPGDGPKGPAPHTARQTGGGGPGEYMYLHRLSGTDADGRKRYGLGFWDSKAAYLNCGAVEGIATQAGGTETSVGISLDTPDGPLSFTPDATWQALIDELTSPLPPPPPGGWAEGMPQPMGMCNSSAEHCSGVKNADLDDPSEENCEALHMQSQPGDMNSKFCWGGWDPETDQFDAFTNDQCKNMCYQDNFWYWEVQQVLHDVDNGFCLQDRRPQFNGMGPPEWVGTGSPVSRKLFEELVYSSNTAASLTAVQPTETIMLYNPEATHPGENTICHMTRTIKINVAMASSNIITGEFNETATLQAGDPDACTDDSNSFNFVAEMVNNPTRQLFKLTK